MDCDFYCPIYDKDIDEGMCYDIFLVSTSQMTANAIDIVIDKDKTCKICKECQHYVMKQK